MSAYIVDNRTIDIIIDGMAAFEVNVYSGGRWLRPSESIEDRQAVGQMLLDANYESVNARYDESEKAPEYQRALPSFVRGLYKFSSTKALNILLGCVWNFEYQSCEAEGWNDNPVRNALAQLEREAMRRVFDLAGLPHCWGVESDEELAELLK